MKIDPLVAIGLGGAAAWLAYNWWQSSQRPASATCTPTQIAQLNQTGTVLAAADPGNPNIVLLRNQITACGGTPTF